MQECRSAIEKPLIRHCAPVLAGIKTANLFRYCFQPIENLPYELDSLSEELNRKGVFLEVLKYFKDSALIYVYRRDYLERDLCKENSRKLLSVYGYNTSTSGDESFPSESDSADISMAERYLTHLKTRFTEANVFPHEIGLFLGYPYEDVKGFIDHKGQDFLFCDLWKVYANPEMTRKLFAKFRKCMNVYERLFNEGRSLSKLTVAA